MKTFLTTLSPLILIAALAFSTAATAAPANDREPTSVEFLEGKVHRLSMELEEVKFKLKDKTITKTEQKQLKHSRKMLKRELSYNQELLSHARYPYRYAYPRPYYSGNRYPIRTYRRPVVCPPRYRRPVVIVNNNRSRSSQARRNTPTPTPRTQPQRRPSRSSTGTTVTPPRSRRTTGAGATGSTRVNKRIQSGAEATRHLKPIKP